MSKIYTIFYSWQSDTKDSSRKIIEKALAEAKKKLLDNKGVSIEIDHSTLGECGMPSIDQTILRKIDNCDIFLCDLTPVVKYEKEEGNGNIINKQVPNPNVLIELGYAMSAVGVNYIIPVAHQGQWSPNELPFDINHHAVYCFTAKNCNLTEAIFKVISFIKENGGHRHLDKPYWLHILSVICSKARQGLFAETFDPYKDSITESSASFFKRRMCAAFPGERGLVEYTDQKLIRKALSKLLATPLTFKKGIGYDVCTDPIWWFRSGRAMEIDKYYYLGNGRYLLGWDELKIRRLVAFIESGRYYSNYVYVEWDGDEPTGVYGDYYTPTRIKEIQKTLGYASEEYAQFKPCRLFTKKITKQEEDDGYTKILDRIVDLKKRYECRIRALTPYNYIIAAKQSAFNNTEFDRTSDAMFEGMLNGTITKEQFNDYMMKFPKPSL